jgi:hypothetical protein
MMQSLLLTFASLTLILQAYAQTQEFVPDCSTSITYTVVQTTSDLSDFVPPPTIALAGASIGDEDDDPNGLTGYSFPFTGAYAVIPPPDGGVEEQCAPTDFSAWYVVASIGGGYTKMVLLWYQATGTEITVCQADARYGNALSTLNSEAVNNLFWTTPNLNTIGADGYGVPASQLLIQTCPVGSSAEPGDMSCCLALASDDYYVSSAFFKSSAGLSTSAVSFLVLCGLVLAFYGGRAYERSTKGQGQETHVFLTSDYKPRTYFQLDKQSTEHS